MIRNTAMLALLVLMEQTHAANSWKWSNWWPLLEKDEVAGQYGLIFAGNKIKSGTFKVDLDQTFARSWKMTTLP